MSNTYSQILESRKVNTTTLELWIITNDDLDTFYRVNKNNPGYGRSAAYADSKEAMKAYKDLVEKYTLKRC